MELQKAPQGILGWFSLKVLGRNPERFGTEITPVVEIGDNYLLQGELSCETLLGTNLPIGSSDTAQITFAVPNNKVYRVLGIACDLGLDVADKAIITDWFVTAKVNGTICPIITGLTSSAGINNGAVRVGAYYFPRPLILAPGSSLNIFQRCTANVTVAASQHGYLMRQAIDF